MKKFEVKSEAVYVFAIILLALAVSVLTTADFGISMIVAPAYLLSLKVGALSFGQAEYVIQAGVFIILCLVLKKFKFAYLFSFVTCLIYGFVLDLWRIIPCFNASVTPPESIALWLRAVMFAAGMILTAFSVMLFYKTYIYAQVYDFFVKAVSDKYGIKLVVLKTIVDFTCLAASVIMSLCFFNKLVAIGWGTLIMALFNGTLIGLFSKLFDKFFVCKPAFPRFSSLFELK